jgi:MFS family permease
VTSSSRHGRLLRNAEFRALGAAQVASEVGDQFARVAVAGIVLDRSGSVFYSALAFVVGYVPGIVGALLLGPLADRLPRKALMIGCDLARAVLIALLAVAAASSAPLWTLMVLLLASELFSAPFDAARLAVLPDVLPDPADYLAGAGLCRTLYQVNQVLGLAAGGVVVYLPFARAAETAMAADAATFVVSALLLSRLARRPAARPDASVRGLLSDVRRGAVLVFTDPVRRVFVALGWAAGAVLIAPEALGLAYAVEHGQARLGGAMIAALPAGAAVGSWVLSRRGPEAAVRAIRPLLLLGCAPLVATGLDLQVPPTLVLWVLAGACSAFLLPIMVVVNLTTPPERRGAVNGLAAAGFNASIAGAFMLAGLAADAFGPARAVAGAGVLGLGQTVAAHLFWPGADLARALAPPPPVGPRRSTGRRPPARRRP